MAPTVNACFKNLDSPPRRASMHISSRSTMAIGAPENFATSIAPVAKPSDKARLHEGVSTQAANATTATKKVRVPTPSAAATEKLAIMPGLKANNARTNVAADSENKLRVTTQSAT